jgi:hypothetical protein
MHVCSIGSDEQHDEGVVRSHPFAAMGTDAGRRGGEVVVDPPPDGRLFNFVKIPGEADLLNSLDILNSMRDRCIAVDLRKPSSPSVHG